VTWEISLQPVTIVVTGSAPQSSRKGSCFLNSYKKPTTSCSLRASMLHFPSSLPNGSNGVSRRTDSLSLNATQQKSASHPIFLKVEEELHDARRVQSDGQEDDLRYALNMVINRVSELVRFQLRYTTIRTTLIDVPNYFISPRCSVKRTRPKRTLRCS